ncbi:MAG TPA: thioesterase family protein [Cyclobacteriaceae bacterium]|nr:thioesterase family protein [Cyclobacteriaceae bacterium]
MYKSETSVRVRYAETDQMGYVYYGNYAIYYEVARVESFRQLGLNYKELEDAGVLMPVLEHYTRFIAPARYDEVLRIITSIAEMPGTRIKFSYEIFNEANKMINTGETTLVFIDKQSGRPTKRPEVMAKLLEPYLNEI